MNVNQVSFGRTVKVNAPLKVAEHVADLVNSLPIKKGEARVQQQLKTFFYDAEHGNGRARAIAPNGKNGDVFILTGDESIELGELIKDRETQLNAAKNNYGEKSDFYSYVKEAENDRFKDVATLLISDTLEPVELDIDYSQRKHRIKSIDIVF